MATRAGYVADLKRSLRPLKDYFRFEKESVVLVHIGKCGGRTLKNGLSNAKRNMVDNIVHVYKPVYRSDLKYIVVARDPVSRLISAFNWRYRLVVEEKVQRDRFKGEYEVLTKYQNLNALAEALYFNDGEPNRLAHKEANMIHHVFEGISYYLTDLLEKCRKDQIVGLLMQESLNQDIERVFGYRNELNVHNNSNGKLDPLTATAKRNLKEFLAKDYVALRILESLAKEGAASSASD